jgi:Glycosyltransferase 61
LKTVDPAAKRPFPTRDYSFLRELRGQKAPFSLDKILRKALRLNAAEERKALLYYGPLPAPSRLATEDPFVDDELLTALIRIRAGKPRWEAAWHLRGDIRVAPGHPLVFVNNRFVPGSAGFNEDLAYSSAWKNYARRLMGLPTLRVDRAILLRDFWDGNYWHLLHDILPKLVMAEAIGLDPTIPVVVSATLMNRHGDRMSGTNFLQGRTVIVQPEKHTLCCKELFLLRPGEFARHWTPGVVARIPAEPNFALGSRYIYCRREPESSIGRTADNSLEIEEIFRAAGFAVVDPAPMTLGQQKAIFEQAEVIAGINGAALANALFRHDKPLTIGALISSNLMSTTLPTMAKVFGFGYTGFVVPPVADGPNSPVLVPPDTVRRLIERVLKRAARA